MPRRPAGRVLVLLSLLLLTAGPGSARTAAAGAPPAPAAAAAMVIQVRSAFPQRRFDEEYVRPQRQDIRDLTRRIETLAAAGKSTADLQAERAAKLAAVDAEQAALAQSILRDNERAFDQGIAALAAFLAGYGIRGERQLGGRYRADLPPAVAEAVRALPYVVRVEPVQRIPAALLIANAGPTVGAPAFWNATPAITGAGIKVGIVDNGIDQQRTAGYLKVTAADNCGNLTFEGSHGSNVAAIVGQNQAGAPHGIAYGVQLYDAFALNLVVGYETQIHDTCQAWLVQNGVNVANASFGVSDSTAPDWDYDYYADRYPMLQVAALGNVPAPRVLSPAEAWNVLSVSATDDGGNTDRQDDRFASDISVQGPTADGRKKPELSAPGKAITTLFEAGASGTSFAAPQATGLAALVMQCLRSQGIVDNLQLRSRALLINSAENRRSSKDPVYGWWDPQWGWGYVSGAQAQQDACSPAPRNALDSVTQGGVTRLYFTAGAGTDNHVTLVWKRRISDDRSSAYLSNLDLRVYDDTTGALLDASTATGDTVEYVRFRAPVTGTYRVEVSGVTLAGTDRQYFIVAASQPLRSQP